MSLADEFRRRIERDGPLGIDEWMAVCNAHYYAKREVLGSDGDFVTSPEISQMFGEMVGAALADCWVRAGSPPEAIYAELGPGRGTLAADALRVMHGAGFREMAHLVETSGALREEQAERIGTAQWFDHVGELPPRPLLCVANEFFDALPARQLSDQEERKVTLGPGGGFAFTHEHVSAEPAPQREQAMRDLAIHLARHGGVALVIDYGHEGGRGDTLQAVRGHEYADPLADAGEQDLTIHVDFAALAKAARAAGCAVDGVIGQGSWLEALGIGARASSLAAANPERTEEIAGQRRRLCDESEMGTLFKVLAVRHVDWPAPAGLAT